MSYLFPMVFVCIVVYLEQCEPSLCASCCLFPSCLYNYGIISVLPISLFQWVLMHFTEEILPECCSHCAVYSVLQNLQPCPRPLLSYSSITELFIIIVRSSHYKQYTQFSEILLNKIEQKGTKRTFIYFIEPCYTQDKKT